MMNSKAKLFSVVGVAVLMAGCSSNNIREFRPDLVEAKLMKRSLTKKVGVKGVSMKEGNSNSIMCRLAGFIYLPGKMTYSQYIERALTSTLMAMDKFDDSCPSKGISVDLSRVTFSSVSGEWYIDGTVFLNGKNLGEVKSMTPFGTSFIAISACRNVADAFEKASSDFVRKVVEKVSLRA